MPGIAIVATDSCLYAFPPDLFQDGPDLDATRWSRLLDAKVMEEIAEIIELRGEGDALSVVGLRLLDIGSRLQAKGTPKEASIADKDGSTANRSRQPLMGVDHEGVGLGQITIQRSNVWVEYPK